MLDSLVLFHLVWLGPAAAPLQTPSRAVRRGVQDGEGSGWGVSLLASHPELAADPGNSGQVWVG